MSPDEPEDSILSQLARVNRELVELVGEARIEGAREGLALARTFVDNRIAALDEGSVSAAILLELSEQLVLTQHQIHNIREDDQ